MIGLFGLLSITAAPPPLTVAPVEPRLASAADAYRTVWQAEGPRMIAALERVSGFPFPTQAVEAFVWQGLPMAEYGGRTIRLRASYPLYFKQATLMHELGHLLAFSMPNPARLDDHRLLYLFLYDAWTDLYGREYADRMADIENRIVGGYDYEAAWAWARAMTRDQRQAMLASLRTPLPAAP